MSSDITALEQALISDYINLSADVLFLFDCIMTLSQEVDVIWRRKWNTTTWLYALTRYSVVMDSIFVFVPVWDSVSCEVGMYVNQALTLTQYLCLAWFSALRVYALLDGKYLVPALVLLLNIVPFATNILNSATSTITINTEECTSLPGVSNDLLLSFSLATRISVIIGDVLVLAVTWTKTAHAYREARRLNIRAPLATMLFRDGAMKGLIALSPLQLLTDEELHRNDLLLVRVPDSPYIVAKEVYNACDYTRILLILNILQMMQDNVPVLLSIDFINPFSINVPPMIVCRFILNLRQIEPAGSSWASGHQSHSLRFVGNMGQSLQFGVEDADGEEEAVPGVEGTSAEDAEVDEEYVRRNYDTEQEPTYADV